MAKILVNDGIHPTGKEMMIAAGHEVYLDKISQEDLDNELKNFDAICVRSATKIRKSLIDKSPNLRVIARGGVGLDNIDVEYAKSKGIEVYNTPAASSRSVAELAIAHILNLSRSIQDANRKMPVKGNTDFKDLKKSYSAGMELEGKTIGIIGFGRIGQETARIALGLGMNVLPVDLYVKDAKIAIGPKQLGQSLQVNCVEIEEMMEAADYISIHVPSTDKPIIGRTEIEKMKNGVILVNTARGGSIDEDALLEALESGKIQGVGLDVFVGEPKPRNEILNHPKISLSPHIGASTLEAQEKIGIELANQINTFFEG